MKRNIVCILALALFAVLLLSSCNRASVGDESSVDTGSAEEISEMALDSPYAAAEKLGSLSDTATYEYALRDALDALYSSGNTEATDQFVSSLDSRGDEIAANYAEAEKERSSADDLGYMTGEALVMYSDTADESALEKVICDSRGSVVSNTDLGGVSMAVVEISLEDTVDRAISKISQIDGVITAQADYKYESASYVADDVVNDTYKNDQWYLDSVSAPDAWEYIDNTEHEKVRVAVIDTGVDLSHEDLSSVINTGLSVKMNWDGSYTPLSGDSDTHGTHVSGIIAGVANNSVGIAGTASAGDNSVVDLMVVDAYANGYFQTSTMIYSMKYAMDNGAKVVNLSVTGSSGSDDQLFETAVTYLASNGTVLVCAAGNSGSSGKYMPSDTADAISVIALNEQNKRASFSNYGSTENKISAPGVDILSTVPGGYELYDGTSMATPIVTSVVAMMLSVNPDLTVDAVKDILSDTADDLYTSGYDSQSGCGKVNAYAAVIAADAYSGSLPESISLDKTEASIAVGGSITISATVLPAGSSTGVCWSSSDENVASVDESGTVSGVSIGAATITASTSNGLTAQCSVTVTQTGAVKLGTPLLTSGSISGGTSRADIYWQAVVGADQYEVWRSRTYDGDYELVGTTPGTEYTDSLFEYDYGLFLNDYAEKRDYYYKIRAVGDSDTEKSDFSDVITYLLPSVINGDLSLESYLDYPLLSWYYFGNSELMKSTDGVNYDRTASCSGGQYSIGFDDSITEGTTYYYYVRSYDGDTETGRSSVSSFKLENDFTGGLTLAQNGVLMSYDSSGEPVYEVSVSALNTDRYASYQNSSDTTYFIEVMRTTTPEDSGSWKFLEYVSISTGTITDSDFEPGTTYYYKARICCEKTTSDDSGGIELVKHTGEYSQACSVTAPSQLETPELSGSVSGTVNSLSWDSVDGASRYCVYRATGSNRTFKLVATVSGNATGYTDSSVVSGEYYYYKIAACTNDSSGYMSSNYMKSDYSPTIVLHYGGKLTAPIFSITSGTYFAPQTISLTTQTDGGTIYYTTDGSAPNSSSTRIVYSDPFTVSEDTTLKACTCLDGTYSPVSVKTLKFATAPGKTSLSVSTGDGTVYLSWSIQDGGSALSNVYITTGGDTVTLSGNATSYTFTGLSNGTAYTFTVWGVNGGGAGEASSVSATPSLIPSAPELDALYSDGKITVTWSAPYNGGAEITGYLLRLDSGDTMSVSKDVFEYEFTGVSADTCHSIVLWAVNSSGKGAYASKLLPAQSTWNMPYTDVYDGSWYYSGVEFVSKYGLFNGTSKYTFSPDISMSRAMLVTVLYRLDGQPGTAGTNIFTDVGKNLYYTDAVIWASENGIINGVTSTLFDPDSNITREQMATILYRYAIYKGNDTTQYAEFSGYADRNEISGYAESPMHWAVGSHLIEGMTPTTLAPKSSATRAQVAVILARFMQNTAY